MLFQYVWALTQNKLIHWKIVIVFHKSIFRVRIARILVSWGRQETSWDSPGLFHRVGRTDKSSIMLHYSSKSMKVDVILESPMSMNGKFDNSVFFILSHWWFQNNIDFHRFWWIMQHNWWLIRSPDTMESYNRNPFKVWQDSKGYVERLRKMLHRDSFLVCEKVLDRVSLVSKTVIGVRE